MGQKTNPIGLRVAVNKDWGSKWFAEKKDFGKLLTEDRKIREILKSKLEGASVSQNPARTRRLPLPHHYLYGAARGGDRRKGRRLTS